jgi:hypothetical protein
MSDIVIDISNPIHAKFRTYFENSEQKYVLSNDIGEILIQLGYINSDMTIEEVNTNVLVRKFIRDKLGQSFSENPMTSIYGKDYNVSDQYLFLLCNGNPNYNNYIAINMPSIPSVHKENLRKSKDKLFKYVNVTIPQLISGFPLSDKLDPREANVNLPNKRKKIVPIVPYRYYQQTSSN